MLKRTKRTIAVVLALSLTASCATTGAGGRPATEVEKAMGQCVAAVAIGALAGAIIGNNTGSGDADRGARRGALVGVGVCVVLIAMANQRDRERIAQLQIQAAANGQNQVDTYPGNDGRTHRIETWYKGDVPDPEYIAQPPPTAVDPTPAPAAAARLCRHVDTRLTVQGAARTATINDQIVCRNPDGQWAVLETTSPPPVVT